MRSRCLYSCDKRRQLVNVVCHHDDSTYRHESWVTRCEGAEVLDRYAGWHESLLRLFAAGDTYDATGPGVLAP